MKKSICCFLTIGIFILASCTNANTNNSVTSLDIAHVEYYTMEAYWHIFQDAKEIVEYSDKIIIGEIAGINFQVLDMTTGYPPTEGTEKINRSLYTIYDVDISTSYKGDAAKSMQFMVSGGLKDYRVEEQLTLMQEKDTYENEAGIPIMDGVPELQIGKSYLLVLCTYEDDCPSIIPYPPQAIYCLDDPFDKHVSSNDISEDPKLYYSEKTDAFGNPLISAKDVIEHFGEDKWDTFWTKWQKDNPKWETRLDKAAVEKVLSE